MRVARRREVESAGRGMWWSSFGRRRGVCVVGCPSSYSGALTPHTAMGCDCCVAWLELLSRVGAGGCRPCSIHEHSSRCVHARSFPGKSANQLPASDAVHTRRPFHTQPLRPPPVQVDPVIWAWDPAFAPHFRSQRSSFGRTSRARLLQSHPQRVTFEPA